MTKNKLRFFFICILVCSIKNGLHAQQYPQFTQYTYNMNIVNPAYVGVKNTLSINLLGRTQWVGVEGAPKTGTLGIHSPIGIKRSLGVGFSAIYNEIGPLKETHLYGDLAYKINLSNEGVLSFGLKLGVSLFNLNQAMLRFNATENLNTDVSNKAYPNLGFGMYFSEKNFYIGASIPNILNTNFLDFESNLNTVSEVPNNSTLYIGSGYVFTLNKNLKLKPAMMLRYSSTTPVALDISSTVFIQEIFELGMSYRVNESVAAIAALNINNNFRVGYSYDFSIGDIYNNNGSHEIMLLYDIDIKDRIRRIPKYY